MAARRQSCFGLSNFARYAQPTAAVPANKVAPSALLVAIS